MKKLPLLILLAVFLLLAVASLFLGAGSALDILVLPFTLTASLLRALSLSGTVGNITAIVLFLVLGLLPMLFKIRKQWHREDLLLAVCSVTLWYALYYLINPGLRPGILAGEVGAFILAGSVYSTLLCWAVILLMNHCKDADTEAIYRALEIFLLICAATRGGSVFPRFSGFLTSLESVAAANTMPNLNLIPTNIFLFLSFAVAAAEYLLNAFVFYLSAKLVACLRQDPYSEESAAASRKASAWCRRTLIIITVSYMVLDLAQILFASHLHNLAAQVQFPVLSIAVVFALLVLSSLLAKGKALKEDNDLFI